MASKTFKEILRDRRTLSFLVAFPVIFVVVFGSATFDTGLTTSPHAIAVINQDEGAWIVNNTTLEFHNFGEEMVSILGNVTYENSTTHIFRVFPYGRADADRHLANRNIAAIVTIPANFSVGVRAVINKTISETVSNAIVRAAASGNLSANASQALANYTLPPIEENVTATIVIEGDFTYSEFAASQAFVQGFVDGYVAGVARATTALVLDFLPPEIRSAAPQGPFVDARTQGVAGTEQFKVFDWMAPGLFVFATLLIAMGVATAVARETEGGNIERLKTSKMRSSDFLFGILIPWSALGSLQVVLLFATAIVMGFHWQGGVMALLFAIAVGTLSAVAAVALGLLLSTAVKSERQATGVGPLVVVPLAFLTEAFFPISFTLLVAGSPWGLAVRSLRSSLTFGLPMDFIWPSLGWMALQTVVLFAVAAVIFKRTRLSPQ